ncbi:MAG: hypothetical protein QOF61_1847 [Acidobacteriota bacterium]|jgi:hypothetical protein|nr:hypothetical protein [Acidobacteriota bacterium]
MALTGYATVNDAVPVALLFPQKHEEHQPAIPEVGQPYLQKRLNSIFKAIKSPVIRATVDSVAVSLARLCDLLRIVETNTGEEGPLPVTLVAFSLVHHESKCLIQYIEKETSKVKSIKGALRHALDGTSFVLRHELKRVFSQELSLLDRGRKSNLLRADVMRAHGLLSNCFEQSILMLARVFDPSVSGALLFGAHRERLEQSNTLIRDLSALAQLARQAEAQRDAEASDSLIRELKAFCGGPLHYLMYKDWDEFEDITREVTSSYGSARHGFMLHCFATYLDALMNQVQMRAVLNEGLPERREPKAAKKGRGSRR